MSEAGLPHSPLYPRNVAQLERLTGRHHFVLLPGVEPGVFPLEGDCVILCATRALWMISVVKPLIIIPFFSFFNYHYL